MIGFEKIIESVSPSTARARAENRLAAAAARQAREVLAYDGARVSASGGWTPINGGPNAAIEGASGRLNARARDLVRNSPLAARAVQMLATEMVGTGHTPRLTGAASRAGARGEDLLMRQQKIWARFVAASDPEGLQHFHAQARLSCAGMIESGDVFLRYYPVKAGGPSLIQCQTLEGDFLDRSRNSDLPGGGYIRYGIEFDRTGRRAAYWLFDQHPGETGAFSRSFRSSRVPAADVEHIFDVRRPGQILGATWLAPVIKTLRDRDDYLAAERVRAKMAACLAIVVRGARPGALGRLGGTGATGSQSALGASGEALTDGNGRAIESLAPGLIAYTGSGEDVDTVQPPSIGDLDRFVGVTDHDVAAGLGLAHFMLTGDLSQVNYSSTREGKLQFWSLLNGWQGDIVQPRIYGGAWRRVMAAEARMGNLPPDWLYPEWSAPRRPWVDPLRDAQAALLEIAGLLKSHPDAIAERGGDPYQVVQEIADWQKRLEDLGIPLDLGALVGVKPARAAPAD